MAGIEATSVAATSLWVAVKRGPRVACHARRSPLQSAQLAVDGGERVWRSGALVSQITNDGPLMRKAPSPPTLTCRGRGDLLRRQR
jgi:hypothetical protein